MSITISDFYSNSNVNHPQHYNLGKYECIDVIYDWGLDFDLGNALKYICRAGKKEPKKTIEDLEKASFYINHKISLLKKAESEEIQNG